MLNMRTTLSQLIPGIYNNLNCPVFKLCLHNLDSIEDLLPTIKTEVVTLFSLKEEVAELVRIVVAPL